MQNRNLTLNVQEDGATCTATIINIKYMIFYLRAVVAVVARKAHNLEVGGSNPSRAINTGITGALRNHQTVIIYKNSPRTC